MAVAGRPLQGERNPRANPLRRHPRPELHGDRGRGPEADAARKKPLNSGGALFTGPDKVSQAS
jgi:hypothetical protein